MGRPAGTFAARPRLRCLSSPPAVCGRPAGPRSHSDPASPGRIAAVRAGLPAQCGRGSLSAAAANGGTSHRAAGAAGAAAGSLLWPPEDQLPALHGRHRGQSDPHPGPRLTCHPGKCRDFPLLPASRPRHPRSWSPDGCGEGQSGPRPLIHFDGCDRPAPGNRNSKVLKTGVYDWASSTATNFLRRMSAVAASAASAQGV